MLDFIIGLICLIAALGVVLLRKVYFAVPLYELKRQAIKADFFASKVYPLVAHQAILQGLLWFFLVVFSGIALVLFNQFAPLWLGVILVIVWLWLVFSWLPNRPPRAFGRKLAIAMVPILSWLINAIYPIVKRAEEDIAELYPSPHSGIYEVEDLRFLLARQLNQLDNRISVKDINRIEQVLTIDHIKVGSYIVPLQKLLILNSDDIIGPKLLDEMHRSNQGIFLVAKNKHNHQLIGVLNREEVGLKSEGRVGDFMHHSLSFINENESIEQALSVFAEHNQSLIVVVANQDKEPLGVLSLGAALAVLLNKQSNQQIDQSQLVSE